MTVSDFGFRLSLSAATWGKVSLSLLRCIPCRGVVGVAVHATVESPAALGDSICEDFPFS